MDAGSEAVDLMVREGLQITEASIKLLAAGSKNLAAFIYALAKDNKRVSGRTNMGRLLREGKELRRSTPTPKRAFSTRWSRTRTLGMGWWI